MSPRILSLLWYTVTTIFYAFALAGIYFIVSLSGETGLPAWIATGGIYFLLWNTSSTLLKARQKAKYQQMMKGRALERNERERPEENQR